MHKKILGTIGIFALAASPAVAGKVKAAACAAKLSPEGQQMYGVVAPHVKAKSDIEQLSRKHVRNMVTSGQLTISNARANGKMVGRCLTMLKS